MKVARLGCLLALSFTLGSCATGYQDDDNYIFGGGDNTRIDAKTMLVTYNATRYTPQSTINTYLLYRCAQATIDNGYDYFVIVSSSLPRMNVNLPPAGNLATYSEKSNYSNTYGSPYGAGSIQSSSSVNARYQPDNSTSDNGPHAASAVIKMYKGQMPPGFPRGYDAKQVVGKLAPYTYKPF